MQQKGNFPRIRCRIMECLNKISVEPTMWLYMMAYMITSVIEQEFFLYKSCRVDHGFSEEICSNLNVNQEAKQKVQLTVSEFHQWNDIGGHIVPIILSFFIGNWSDGHGRKMPLIIGLIGKFIYSFMIVINSIMTTWRLDMIIYTATLPMGLLGGDLSIFASCFAYISDVSCVKERTLRVTVLDVIYLSSMPIGVAMGSFLYYNIAHSSYTFMFTVNALMLLLAIIYSLYSLKWQTNENQVPMKWRTCITDFFDKYHVQATVNTLTKKREKHRRTLLWIILICMILYTFQRDEKPMSYLYTQLKFNWRINEFSHFRTFHSALFVSAMLVAVPIMNKLLLLEDSTMVIFGALSHAGGRIFFALARTWQIFYLGGVIAALGPIAAPALRSIASKIVPADERGKIFSILSVCDNAVPLFSGILYSQLYNATIQTAPNQIFWLTFSSQVVVFLLMMVFHLSNSLRSSCSISVTQE